MERPAAGSPGGVQETPVQQRSNIDVSDIPVVTPEHIQTNGSYVARIALGDGRARALIQHGGKPESIAVLFHSCPRSDPYCNRNPSLVIRYEEIRFAVTVDEATRTVLGGSALVPSTPDPNKPFPTGYKTHDSSTGIDTVYLGDAPDHDLQGDVAPVPERVIRLFYRDDDGSRSVESPSNLDGIVARYPGGPPARTAVPPRP
jgi:hypothetical protein